MGTTIVGVVPKGSERKNAIEILGNHMPTAFQTSMSKSFIKTLFRMMNGILGPLFAHNTIYPLVSILKVLIYAAVMKIHIEEAATKLRDITNGETPSPDTVFRRLSELTKEQAFEIFDLFVAYVVHRARKKGLLDGSVRVALDGHDVPFYGKEKPPEVRGTKKTRGTHWAFQYLVADIVVKGERFTLGILPVPSLADLPKLVKELLQKVRALVEIETIVVDRGFYGSETIREIMDMDITYQMPIPRNKEVKERIEANRGYRYAIEDIQISKKNRDVMATLVIAPSPRKDREIIEKDKEFVFITNGPVEEETISDHIDQYDSRWGIETGFRVRNGFQMRTNTDNVVLRYFFFLLAAMLYDFWLLANVLKGWKPNDHYDYEILARDFRWALEYLIAFDIRPDG
jgi:DNA-binding Lrp family transcriptional regulator